MKVTIKDRVLYSPCPTIDIPCCSIFSVLKTGVESAAKKIVLVDDRLQLTPAEFLSRAKRYAVGFQAHGVKPGDLQHHIAAGDASRILTDPKNEPKAIRVKKLLDLKDVFVMGATADGTNASEFESADEKSFEELPVPDPKATVVALAFAVDRAGPPKAVEITHYSFVVNFYTCRTSISDDGADVILASHPIAHMAGFLYTLVAALIGKTCVVCSPSLPFDKLVRVIDEYKVIIIYSKAASFLFQIIDVATGEKLGPNEAGELCYRIPSVMKGYYKDPEKTAQVMDAEGWCRSGMSNPNNIECVQTPH
ncbi:AMP dependent CoA ligase, putative [Ixodes scapularis]|uniref:AMP dependent CoA ligase, putative n=1 Tax=Ixodes scapularis TaxID=6945 RepID=B7PCP2_IXOSC|nr:AMP dependent CoA ligase, putative [Ixodes scapularis]|eukprot:XP_002410086.1 AMP dependent CoA ligase, putative [Ixodes scapularis]